MVTIFHVLNLSPSAFVIEIKVVLDNIQLPVELAEPFDTHITLVGALIICV